MSKSQCACLCGGRLSKPRGNKGKRGGMKFISGHTQYRRESLGKLTIHNARKGRRPSPVRLFDGRVPSALRRNIGGTNV
jgi:hypothetical protein